MQETTPRYAMARTVHLSYEEADRRVREELRNEGFGVLTEIDVKATLKAKIGADIPPYEILGACNPPLAHRAISAEPDVGLLLPCNVVVRSTEDEDVSIVEALDPVVQLELADQPALREVAEEVRGRLERVVRRVAGEDTAAGR